MPQPVQTSLLLKEGERGTDPGKEPNSRNRQQLLPCSLSLPSLNGQDPNSKRQFHRNDRLPKVRNHLKINRQDPASNNDLLPLIRHAAVAQRQHQAIHEQLEQ